MRADDDRIAVLVRQLANELLPRAGEIATIVTQAVTDAVPELAPHRSLTEIAVIRESTEQNIGAILATMAFGVAPDAVSPPVGTVALFPQIIAGGGDITTLLHGYRFGHEHMWRAWVEHLAERLGDSPDFYPALRLSSAHIFSFINGACENLVTQYRTQYGLPGTGPSTSPRDAVAALLGDDAVDLDAATLTLRYDLRAHHVALAAVPLVAGADVRSALDDLARAADGAALLAHPVGDGSWWAWLGWSTAPVEEKELHPLMTAPVRDVSIGRGEPGRGREGFRRSHAQAREAERTAGLSGTARARVVRHRDIEVAALLCADPERARRLAADRLGRLAARDEGTTRLRETVRIYLAHGRSVARTAETLHVHQKTVAYRLARATELLGRPVTELTQELESALLIDATLDGR